MFQKKHRFCIGIDTGTHTGIAVWDRGHKALGGVETVQIHRAMERVLNYHISHPGEVYVFVEDARLATHNRQSDVHKAQGAGSIKRDAAIWEGFLTDKGIPFEMVRPDNKTTKMNSDLFKRSTGYPLVTTQHGRDAAMIVYRR